MHHSAAMKVFRSLVRFSVVRCVIMFAPAFAGAAETQSTGENSAPSASGPGVSAAEKNDAKIIFAGQCSWCHGNYGMTADKGPRLAGTQMTQHQVEARIRDGKEGLMPSFRAFLDDDQIALMGRYIKSLNP
jgi:mono/diheme cytochrome c family protein